MEAEQILTPEALVVMPLGAQAKEHGPHLRLNNDWIIAEYLKSRVLSAARVVVAPTIGYHFYPAFIEYPGSISLELETARDLVVQICKSIARFGPRRFYVLNTGISTIKALRPAGQCLASERIILSYTDLEKLLGPVESEISQQEGGTHADEIETSIMLYIAPESVEMSRAAKDYDGEAAGPLTRKPSGKGIYSPTGTWGDPTLASREKGERLVEALVAGILAEIEDLRNTALP